MNFQEETKETRLECVIDLAHRCRARKTFEGNRVNHQGS